MKATGKVTALGTNVIWDKLSGKHSGTMYIELDGQRVSFNNDKPITIEQD